MPTAHQPFDESFDESFDLAVIGGGIAGLSTAVMAQRLGAGRVVLLERETLLASHSTGRNAAIFRHVDERAAPTGLSLRSRAILDELLGDSGWLRRVGAVYVAADDDDDDGGVRGLDAMAAAAAAAGLSVERRCGAELRSTVGALAGGCADEGLVVADDGVIDVHAVVSGLTRRARQTGVQVRTGAAVRQIEMDRQRVTGVTLEDGTRIAAGHTVIAAGAWSAGLAQPRGLALPLVPWRRHLALLDTTMGLSASAPVVWQQGNAEAYFRVESGSVLACPCDEEAWPACLPATDPEALVRLGARLERLAPQLATGLVRRHWACLRTFVPDRGFVLGPDPRVGGLSWCAGLGGHGMTAGVAAGECVARALLASAAAAVVDARLRPARLLSSARAVA